MTNGKTDYAYSIIKSKILEGVLAPLSDISEESLQVELEISRTPIREAIQRLQKEGFVYIYPRKSTIVTEITPDLIHEIYQMRELNEAAIACEACRNISSDWLILKRSAFENPSKDLNEEQLRRYFIELDRELHVSLLEYCNNRFLKNIMTIVYDHIQRIRIKASRPIDKLQDNAVQEHIEIIEAILTKDNQSITETVKTHIKNSKIITLGYYNFRGIL